MHFKEFLTKISSPDFFTASPVTMFTAQTYPPLFFSTLFDWLKLKNIAQIQHLNAQDKDFGSASAALSTTFLGARCICWLGNIDELDAAHKKKMIPFLASYAGPHAILYFVPQETVQKDSGIALPDTVDKQIFTLLFSTIHGQAAAKRAAPSIMVLFARTPAMQLDTACMLMRYIVLLGANPDEFMAQWLDALVAPDQSLFTLSQYFFAKNAAEFFPYWARIAPTYSEIFWVTFWSEQVWRASHVVGMMKRNQIADAKAVAYRLPFSLLQRDWKKLSADELRSAHDFIYSIDCSLKNGGSAYSLDLFYSKFFLNQFALPKS